jgi:hypothetical protein
MDTLEQELANALTAAEAEKPGDCGCKESPSANFSMGGDDALSSELEAALDAVESENGFGATDDVFADLAVSNGVDFNELVSVLERHPGLKISFSF